jgi:hypothetical protein
MTCNDEAGGVGYESMYICFFFTCSLEFFLLFHAYVQDRTIFDALVLLDVSGDDLL